MRFNRVYVSYISLSLFEWFLPFSFSDQNVTWISYILRAYHVGLPLTFLGLIELIILCGKWKLWRSSLCTFLQPPLSRVVGPTTITRTLFCSTCTFMAVESVFGPRRKNVLSGKPGKADRLNILSLYRKDWLSVSVWPGLGLKGLMCTVDR
jgi:hypothetical protein